MFILNYYQLIKGDIILDRDDSRQSDIIRKYTNSEYSHARLYVGGTIIESEGLGVQSVNPQRLLYKNKEDVIVMRSNASMEQIDQACMFARSQCSKEYSLKDAKKKNSKTVEEPNRQFCTRLVAQAYEYAGYTIVDNAAFCTPRDIEQSQALVQVDDIVHEANENEIEIVKSDGLLKMDGESNKQASIMCDFMEKIRLAANDKACDIQDETQLVQYLIEHPDCDQAFANVLKSHSYYTMWRDYEQANPCEFDVSMFKAKYGFEAKNIAQMILQSTQDVVNVWEKQQMIYQKYFCKLGLQTFCAFLELYNNLIGWDGRRKSALIAVIEGK